MVSVSELIDDLPPLEVIHDTEESSGICHFDSDVNTLKQHLQSISLDNLSRDLGIKKKRTKSLFDSVSDVLSDNCNKSDTSINNVSEKILTYSTAALAGIGTGYISRVTLSIIIPVAALIYFFNRDNYDMPEFTQEEAEGVYNRSTSYITSILGESNVEYISDLVHDITSKIRKTWNHNTSMSRVFMGGVCLGLFFV